jgi:hypothetical protein
MNREIKRNRRRRRDRRIRLAAVALLCAEPLDPSVLEFGFPMAAAARALQKGYKVRWNVKPIP